jgi:hypothetical protein
VKVEASRVPDEERIDTLPRHFGRHLLEVEGAIYGWLRALSTDYAGAYWHFFELSNGGFYMAPESAPLRIRVEGNGFEGTMSADAAGITACLFALSHLSFRIRSDSLARHYYELRDFALEHAEASAIIAATD